MGQTTPATTFLQTRLTSWLRRLSGRRRWALALGCLVLFILAWDLRAVLLDQRYSGSDTFVEQTLELHKALFFTGWGELDGALGPKGPVAALLSMALLLLVGALPLAARLLSVLCHGAMTLQTYDLGRRLGGSSWAGLWAALLCTTSPMVFGWSRIAFHDIPLTVAVLGAMQVMVRVRLDRRRPALLLGLLLGVGIMTKPAFVSFMVVPGLWFVARNLRSRGAALRLLGLFAVMVLVVAPWAIPIAPQLFVTYPLQAAYNATQTLALKAELYLLTMPGSGPLLLAGLVSAWLLWGWHKAERWELALHGLTLVVSLALYLLLFDCWSRYILPLYPIAAILTGAALARVLERLAALGALAARVLRAALALALLGLFVTLNIVGCELQQGDVPLVRRTLGLGLIAPDLRPHVAYPAAARALLRFDPRILMAFDAHETYAAATGIDELWFFRGLHFSSIDPDEADRMHARGQTVSVLLARGMPRFPLTVSPSEDLWPPMPPGHPSLNLSYLWLAARPQRRLLLWKQDPNGVRYEAYRVPPPGQTAAASRATPAVPATPAP